MFLTHVSKRSSEQHFFFVFIKPRTSSTFFIWTNAFELVSRNAAFGPYKNKSLNKRDNTIITYHKSLYYYIALPEKHWLFQDTGCHLENTTFRTFICINRICLQWAYRFFTVFTPAFCCLIVLQCAIIIERELKPARALLPRSCVCVIVNKISQKQLTNHLHF